MKGCGGFVDGGAFEIAIVNALKFFGQQMMLLIVGFDFERDLKVWE